MIDEYISEVCGILGITAPKVSNDTSNFRSKTMMAQCSSNGETIYIAKADKSTPDYMFAIAHELRHVWQIRTNPDLYLNDYKPVGELSVEDYNNQLAELDANAFGAIIMANLFGVKPLWNNLSQNTIDNINAIVPDVVKTINVE